MVVCNNTPIISTAPAACPTTAAAMLPYAQGLCSVNPVTTISCNQGFAPTILSNGQYLTSVPVPQIVSCNQTTSQRPNSADSTSDSPISNFYACNGFYSGSVLPYAAMPLSNSMPQLMSYGTLAPPTLVHYSPKLTNNNQSVPTSSVSNIVHCNQAVYTYPPPLPGSAYVPCASMVNGSSVLQCTQGVCQLAPTVLPTGSIDMYPVPTQVLNGAEFFPVAPSQPIPTNLCSATTASPWKQSYGMEYVWQNEFRKLFENYTPHNWTLLPVNEEPVGIWNKSSDSAKVRFCCEKCFHGWTSMKGRVTFWFVLNPTTGQGLVCLKLYGQRCDRCEPQKYEQAMWYPEEVQKVIINIYNRVGEVYYGFQQVPYHRDRRAGKPRTPHNSDLCQACKDGVCSERR